MYAIAQEIYYALLGRDWGYGALGELIGNEQAQVLLNTLANIFN